MNPYLTVNSNEGKCITFCGIAEGSEQSDSDCCHSSPSHAERRPLRVDFTEMESRDVSQSSNSKKEIEKDLGKFSRKGMGSVRYTQPRLSLLGRPISYRLHKRDIRYRKLQSKIYNFLERPKHWDDILYHITM
ncbi:hypothetical protein ACJMK2_002940 [Sinanodonta woodiana]